MKKSLFLFYRLLSSKNWSSNFLNLIVLTIFLSSSTIHAQTPVGENGKLSIENGTLVNSDGDAIQLRGMSSHGLNWFTEVYNFNSLNTLTNDWGIDVFRIAMYVTEQPDQTKGGYEGNPTFWRQYIDELVDLCGQYGIYAIIDWHILTPGDPTHPDYYNMAKEFWDYMSKKHAGKDHVLYEIANEPNGVNWATCKEYAETIIPIIRSNDPSSIIIIGNPTWSSDVHIASEDPVTGYDNLMYAFHFYAGSHTDSYRQKVTTALNNGVAVFATEWGTTSASGDGAPNISETNIWMQFFEDNNISWCNWSYSDKPEGSSALVAYSAADELWNNTSASGDIVKSKIKIPSDSWTNSGNIPPVVQINRNMYGAYILTGESVALTADAIDADGTVASVKYYADGSLIGTATSSPYIVTWNPTSSKTVKLMAVVTDNGGATNTSVAYTINVVTSINQTAYPSGTPHAVPGIIKGIDFDNGGEMIAYHDLDGVHKGPAGSNRANEGADVEGTSNMGYVVNGEWYEYTCNVVGTGNYDFTLKVASGYAVTGKIHLEVDGQQVGGSVNVPSSGSWGSYQTVTIPNVPLTKGIQVIRLSIDKGYFNFSDLEFITKSDPPSVTLTAPNSGLTVAQGEDVLMTATASDNDGSISRVEFYVGTSKVAEDLTAPYEASWTAQLEGGYSITAVAVDNLGSTATSTAANITVTSDLQPPTTPNLALNKIATASSLETSEYPASNAVDGANGTRWASQFEDPQWIQIDLGSALTINRAILNWEAAYATTYEIQVSSNATSWTSIAIVVGGNGSIDDIVFPNIDARYVRMYGTERSTPYGYSLYEFEIYGEDAPLIPVDGVEVSLSSINLDAGQTETLIASVSPVNASNKAVTWSSDNTDIATVNNSGLVTAIAEGTTTVTVTTVDGNYTDNCTVNVSDIILPSYTLTTETIGAGNITVSPAGGTYIEGTVVTLTATPESGSTFINWSGDISGTSTSKTVTMDDDKSAIANFAEIIIGCEGEEAISMPFSKNGEGEFCFVATGTVNYVNSWNMDLVEINGLDVTNNWANSFPPAEDGKIHIRYLSSVGWAHFEIDGKDGGSVTTYTLSSSVVGEGSISPSSGIFDEGTSVELTATPSNGWRFDGWTVDASGSSNTISITMDDDKMVTATFTEIVNPEDYSLTISSNSNGSVILNPEGGIYTEGTVVSITAIPDAAYVFDFWEGDLSGSVNPTSITMDSDKTVTANFIEDDISTCTFEAPLSSALPSINSSYKYLHVLGNGPDLSNISTFTINWDLSNNGLWDFSVNTTNGMPDWYVNLNSSITQSFGSVEPDITISGSGFSGLDADYWATKDGNNFVLVEKSDNFTLYFSNSATTPCPELKSTKKDNIESEITFYPNPANDVITISGLEDAKTILIRNTLGQVIYQQEVNNQNELSISVAHLISGSYIISTQFNTNSFNNQILLIP